MRIYCGESICASPQAAWNAQMLSNINHIKDKQLPLHLGFKHQARQIPEYQRGTTSHCPGLKASLKKSDKSALIDCLLYALHQYIAITQQRHTCPRARIFHKRLIPPEKADRRAETHQKHHHSPRHHLGLFQQDLHQCTDYTAYPKSIEIIHLFHHPFFLISVMEFYGYFLQFGINYTKSILISPTISRMDRFSHSIVISAYFSYNGMRSS